MKLSLEKEEKYLKIFDLNKEGKSLPILCKEFRVGYLACIRYFKKNNLKYKKNIREIPNESIYLKIIELSKTGKPVINLCKMFGIKYSSFYMYARTYHPNLKYQAGKNIKWTKEEEKELQQLIFTYSGKNLSKCFTQHSKNTGRNAHSTEIYWYKTLRYKHLI